MRIATDSLSDKISCKDFVPNMFRNVDAAKSFVDLAASSTFMTEMTAFKIRKQTTASTDTVTESLVKIFK